MRFKKEFHTPVDKLLEFRETVFEDALENKRVSQEILDTYKELARVACSTNPLARELPDFSMVLLSGMGALDGFEKAVDEEL